jgi:uncharacterized phage protein (TIGR02218 family)
MLTPSWESSVGALAALLNGAAGITLDMVDLYTFTLQGGQVLRYTSGDVAIPVNGNTFAIGPILKRGRIKRSVGITVDTLQVQLSAAATVQVNGVPIIQWITQRGLANARLTLERLYAPAFGAPTGTLIKFTGRVAEVSGGRHEKTLTIKSDTELLDTMVPRDVYQAGCKNTLYDAACGVNRASFTTSSAATGASDATRTSFPQSGLGHPAGYFDLGVVKFTSGANAGVARTVKQHTSGAIIVVLPWPAAIAGGDTYTIVPGCNKSPTDANGCPKFYSSANIILRFRGEPWIPAPETVI